MILLTGATGYLGSQIAKELAARQVQFRVLVRDLKRFGVNPAAAGCEVAVGDVGNDQALAEAMRGAKFVIHTAALVKTWVRDRSDFWRTNVEGLNRLCHAAAEAGVERIIYTSSFIALGPSADASAAEGLRHRGPYANEYAETKARALDWLREEGFRRFPVLALLPGVIYGPGPRTEGNLVGGMVEQYLAGSFPGVLGSGEQRWSFSYNADVVGGHLAALGRGKPGEEYMLAGDNRSLNDFFRLLADLSGVRHKVRHLPFALGKMAGAAELSLAKLFGRTPQLTPGVVEILKHDWVYSSDKARRELGYGVTPLEEGLKKTLEGRVP